MTDRLGADLLEGRISPWQYVSYLREQGLVTVEPPWQLDLQLDTSGETPKLVISILPFEGWR